MGRYRGGGGGGWGRTGGAALFAVDTGEDAVHGDEAAVRGTGRDTHFDDLHAQGWGEGQRGEGRGDESRCVGHIYVFIYRYMYVYIPSRIIRYDNYAGIRTSNIQRVSYV